jgi:flagellin
MALNAISNYAANVAHRNLTASDAAATSSLAKLSSGTRVVSARDDAASLAIGSRLNAEVHALRQASVNAGQAISMLQIGEGAMREIQDILIRMKTLAVQASSGQLSATERRMLDNEYQALLAEVDRIAEDTEFNGNQLVNGLTEITGGVTGSAGVINVAATGFFEDTAGDDGSLSYTYDSAGGGTFTLTATDAASGSAATYEAILSLDYIDTATGLMVTGTAVKLESANSDDKGFLTIALNTSFNPTAAFANDPLNFQTVNTNAYSFKVGSGTAPQDEITVSMNGIGTQQLGLVDTDITNPENADAASEALSLAVDTLNTLRAEIGASQNRLDFAAANIATAVENAEAARSDLMDLDIAAEMTNFTSKQILVQAGVAMLAQANQMPQNLLRLFQ